MFEIQAALRMTVPDWYLDDLNYIQLPGKYYGFQSTLIEYLDFLKRVFANIRFKHTNRFLSDLNKFSVPLDFEDDYVKDIAVNSAEFIQLYELASQLKSTCVEYLELHNSFFAQDFYNGKSLRDLLIKIKTIVGQIVSNFEAIKKLFLENVSSNIDSKDITRLKRSFNSIQTIAKNVAFDVDLRNRDINLFEEIYQSKKKWYDRIDQNKKEAPPKRIRIKPQKASNLADSLRKELAELKSLSTWSLDDFSATLDYIKSDRESIAHVYVNRFERVIESFANILAAISLRKTGSSLRKLKADLRNKRIIENPLESTRDRHRIIEFTQKIMKEKTDIIEHEIELFLMNLRYLEAGIVSQETSIKLQESFELATAAIREPLELLLTINLGSYFRRISLSFLEELNVAEGL